MKRYFFDTTEDDTTFIDEHGLVFANPAMAEREAASAVFDIAKDAAGQNPAFVRVTIRDEIGKLLAMEVKFEITRESRGDGS